MLNINTRISISRRSKKEIRKYWGKKNGILNASSWKSISKAVLNEFSKKLLYNQKYRCVYCERYLYGEGPEMDHFASKGLYPRFTFNPINIFYACSFCNSSSRKGEIDPISVYNNRYDQCLFHLLHPYLDDIDDQIRYKDHDRIYIDWSLCSRSAQNTIVALMLDDLIMTQIRSRDLMFARKNPLVNEDEKALIMESISYLPNR